MQPKLPLSERDRKLQDARQTAARLVEQAHLLPADLTVRQDIAQARRTLTKIKVLASMIEQLLEGLPEQLREFRE